MLDWLKWLVESGHIADIAIICLLLELGFFWSRKSGNAKRAIIFNAASGIAMLLALRAALTDAHFMWIPIALSASFILHLAELKFRETD